MAEVRQQVEVDSLRELMRTRKKGSRKIRMQVDCDRARKKRVAEQLWAAGQLRKL